MFMFDSDVAMIVSTDAAVVFQNIVHWIEKNYANKNNFYDGDYWTYNSAEAFSKLFPFLTKRQMERILKELRDNDLIKTGNFNEHKYDKTMWYALTERGMTFSPMMCNHIRKCVDGNTQTSTPIPDIKPDIKTYSNITAIKSSKNKYGEFNNVLLTDSELVNLVERFGKQGSETRIEKLSGYLASKGDKYKSHYATIINWAKMEAERNNNTPVTQEKTFNDSIPNMWEMKLK